MAFGETALLQVPTVVSSLTGSGRMTKDFSYEASAAVPCHFRELRTEPIEQRQGQSLHVQAIVGIQANNYTVEPESITDGAGAARRQVRIKSRFDAEWVTWELVASRDLGNIGARKELSLRRWKQ